MAPSAASVTVAMRAPLLGTTVLVSLPGSRCQSVKESQCQMPGWRPCCVMAPRPQTGTALVHWESHTRTGQLMESKPFPLLQQIFGIAKDQALKK